GWRWGQGSLQEIDHVPFVRPLVKSAATADAPGEIQGLVDEAIATAMAPPTGPVFLDFPLDHVFSSAVDSDRPAALPKPWRGRVADPVQIAQAVGRLRDDEPTGVRAGNV